jgi:hypothetical protein
LYHEKSGYPGFSLSRELMNTISAKWTFALQFGQWGRNAAKDEKASEGLGTRNIFNRSTSVFCFSFATSPKFTQIRIFGLKTNHLATLLLW